MNLDSGVVDLNRGAITGGLTESVADGIFDDETGKVGIAKSGIVCDIGIDGEGFVKGEDFGPGDFLGFGVEGFSRGALKMGKWPKDSGG